jgi:ubiquinone/menaquinone biosynthesis C-methylase UbiE
MRKVLKDTQGVLEIGAGTGVYTQFLVKDFDIVFATDYDKGMCSKIKKMVPESIVEQADATNLPYPDESFDGVFGVSILHHIPICEPSHNDRRKVWQEIYRVLRPGGWFAFCEPNAYNPFTKIVQWRFGEDALTCKEMQNDAEQVGLKIISYGTLQFCSPRTMFVTKIPFWNSFERLIEKLGLGVSAYVVGQK